MVLVILIIVIIVLEIDIRVAMHQIVILLTMLEINLRIVMQQKQNPQAQLNENKILQKAFLSRLSIKSNIFNRRRTT